MSWTLDELSIIEKHRCIYNEDSIFLNVDIGPYMKCAMIWKSNNQYGIFKIDSFEILSKGIIYKNSISLIPSGNNTLSLDKILSSIQYNETFRKELGFLSKRNYDSHCLFDQQTIRFVEFVDFLQDFKDNNICLRSISSGFMRKDKFIEEANSSKSSNYFGYSFYIEISKVKDIDVLVDIIKHLKENVELFDYRLKTTFCNNYLYFTIYKKSKSIIPDNIIDIRHIDDFRSLKNA